jgi:flagellar hook-associated protein 3 FlgL
MARIGAFHLQQSALLNLQRAQGRELAAAETVATGRKANDLQGFGRGSESITALRTVQTRVETWQAQADALAGKLELQNAHLTETLDAAGDFRAAMQEALAMDRSDGLTTRITAAFQKAAAALNGKHQGQYLFGGGRLEERPFAATELSQLTAVPPRRTCSTTTT